MKELNTSKLCPLCAYGNRAENRYCTQCGARLDDDIAVKPRLLVLTSSESSVVFPIKQGKSLIGRDIANDIVINDEQISKFHAAVLFEKNEIWIQDLQSKNGVYVNGQKIIKSQLLHNGSLVKLGATILKFEMK